MKDRWGRTLNCTIGEFQTLPKILRAAGYECGMVGKWHLGKNLQPQEGFKYWITMPHGATPTFYNAQVIEHEKMRKEPKYLTDLWTEHAVRFINQNKRRPFFLYLAYNGPYGLGPLLLRPARNRHFVFYESKSMDSFPRQLMHPWQFNNKKYLNNIASMRRYAAEVSAVDDGVGAVMAALKKQGLDENTLVIFTADQGWMGGQNGLWGMGDHTRPLGAFDGMMRIPLIVRHPGSIPPGRKTDIMTSNYDLMPTLLSYLGLGKKMPTKPRSPGRDYSAVLRGKKIAWDNKIVYEAENTRAFRTADWKYVERYPDGPHELYDLQADPGEQFNLYGQPRQKQQQEELHTQITNFFNRYADPKYDLWHGGKSKARLLSAKKFKHPTFLPPPIQKTAEKTTAP